MAFFSSGIHTDGFWVLLVAMARVSCGCGDVRVLSLVSGNSQGAGVAALVFRDFSLWILFFFRKGDESPGQVDV